MRSSAVCLLSVVTALDALVGELPLLGPPTGLKITKKDDTSAVLAWHFNKPEDVLFSDIVFVAQVESEGKPTIDLKSTFDALPFKMTLTGLSPKSMYTVKLRATKAEWQDSPITEISFAFPARELPILNSPTNLKVGRGSDTSATLAWDFVKPEHVPFSQIEFVLTVESDGKPNTDIHPRFTDPPFKYSLSGLSPMTTYTVTVQAHTANWRASPVAKISFTTPKIDWPTPVLTEVHSVPRIDSVLYAVKWQIEERADQLKCYWIEICAPKCSETKKSREYVGTILSITYETNFTIRVIAEYELPVLGLIRKSSGFYPAKTGKASVKTTLNAVDAKEAGNRVELAWLASHAPHGPIPYYEFFICDANARSSVLRDFFKGNEVDPKAHRRTPTLNGTVFAMTLGGDAFQTGDSDAPGGSQCLPRQSMHLVVIKQTENAARFRVFFRDHSGDIFGAGLGSNTLRLGPGFAEAFGLSAYTVFSVKIRSCLTVWNRAVDVCGNFSNFEVLSNVAEPSPVEDLRHHWRDSDNELEISWELPAKPRGPIDGYRVSVRVKPPRRRPSSYFYVPVDNRPQADGGSPKVVTLNSTTLSYIVMGSSPIETYEIGVLAFNFGTEDRDEVYEGEWSYLTVAPERASPFLVMVVFIAFIAVLILVAFLIFRKSCTLRGRVAPGDEVELQPRDNLPPRDAIHSPRPSPDNIRTRPPGAAGHPSEADDRPPPYEFVERYPYGVDEGPPAYEDVVSSPSNESSTERFVGTLFDNADPPTVEGPPSGEMSSPNAGDGTLPPSIASSSGFPPSAKRARMDDFGEGSQQDTVGPQTERVPSQTSRDVSSQSSEAGYVASKSSESGRSGFSAIVLNTERDGSLPNVESLSPESVRSPLTGNFPPPSSRASRSQSSSSTPTGKGEKSQHDVDSPVSEGFPRPAERDVASLSSSVGSSGYGASKSSGSSKPETPPAGRNVDRDESPSDVGSLPPGVAPSPLEGHFPPPPSSASTSTSLPSRTADDDTESSQQDSASSLSGYIASPVSENTSVASSSRLSLSGSYDASEGSMLSVPCISSGSISSSVFEHSQSPSAARGSCESLPLNLTEKGQSSEAGSSGYVASQISESSGPGFSPAIQDAERDGSLPDVRGLPLRKVPGPVSIHLSPRPSAASTFASFSATGDGEGLQQGESEAVNSPGAMNLGDQQSNRQENQRRHHKQRKQRRNRRN